MVNGHERESLMTNGAWMEWMKIEERLLRTGSNSMHLAVISEDIPIFPVQKANEILKVNLFLLQKYKLFSPEWSYLSPNSHIRSNYHPRPKWSPFDSGPTPY